MEFCSGGNLAGRIPMTEVKAAHVTEKILSVVKYLHDNGVAHRDIKLENIMFDSKETIKLIDFGLANAYLNDDFKNMTDKVGTLYSMAPEVLMESYDQRCDLWSVGVVAYLLLSGIQPFWGPKKSMPWAERRLEMMARIKRCEYSSMNSYAWENISDEAKSFVKSLLKLNPDDRPSPEEALNSEWIRTTANFDLSEHSACDVQVELKPVLRHRFVQVLSQKLSEGEILGFRAFLENKDEEGDGLVSIADLFRSLDEVSEGMEGLSKEDVKFIFYGVNSTGGTLDETMKLNYIDLMVDVLVGKGRNLVDDFAAALDAKADKSRMISVTDLRTIFETIFPSEMSQDLWDGLCMKSDNETMVNTSDVLESVTVSLARHHKRTIHSN
jgi:serine/threonine protein kinase